MIDEPPSKDAGPETGSARQSSMPRWVKASLLIVAGLIVLVVVLQLAGRGGGLGDHGPGRHGVGASFTEHALA